MLREAVVGVGEEEEAGAEGVAGGQAGVTEEVVVVVDGVQQWVVDQPRILPGAVHQGIFSFYNRLTHINPTTLNIRIF